MLGPTQPVTLERTSSSDVPIEQAINRQRMRPGSGNLSIRVSTDGPTRVLQVVDINKTGVRQYSCQDLQIRISEFFSLIAETVCQVRRSAMDINQ